MKIENTLENKARFFDLYSDQTVICVKNPNYPDQLTKHRHTPYGYRLEWVGKTKTTAYAELKPLSSISDEDAISICRIVTSMYSEDSRALIHGKALIRHFRTQSNLWGEDWIQVIDYLRSNGYALPWMGLSVEDLIEYGWVKLRQE